MIETSQQKNRGTGGGEEHAHPLPGRSTICRQQIGAEPSEW
jgi:hypothetical protein